MRRWAVGQFGDVVDRFRPECPEEAWKNLLRNYSALVEFGKMCGKHVAKKLKNGGDIWELIGHADNCQPRMLFYFSETHIVFVHAWIKKGDHEYKNAIRLAQSRRKLLQRKERSISGIRQFGQSSNVH